MAMGMAGVRLMQLDLFNTMVQQAPAAGTYTLLQIRPADCWGVRGGVAAAREGIYIYVAAGAELV